MKIATIYKNRKESQLIQSICFLACSRRSDSGVQCKVREREKNSRNLRLEVIGWNSGYANTRFHTKLNVRNSLLFHLARFLHSFFISLKANMIKTTAFMTFLDESIKILNHRVQKIGQKSCTYNKNFEPKAQRETLESSLGLAGDRVTCYRVMCGGGVLVAVKSDMNPTPCLILDIMLSGEHRGENIIERPRALFGVLLSLSRRALWRDTKPPQTAQTATRQTSSAITLQWHVLLTPQFPSSGSPGATTFYEANCKNCNPSFSQLLRILIAKETGNYSSLRLRPQWTETFHEKWSAVAASFPGYRHDWAQHDKTLQETIAFSNKTKSLLVIQIQEALWRIT